MPAVFFKPVPADGFFQSFHERHAGLKPDRFLGLSTIAGPSRLTIGLAQIQGYLNAHPANRHDRLREIAYGNFFLAAEIQRSSHVRPGARHQHPASEVRDIEKRTSLATRAPHDKRILSP